MRETTTHTDKGPGLARGPALIIGTILTAIGLVLFLKNGATPTGGFPDGDINGPTFLGVETNGWTAWITTAAGALLLLGAAQHLFAKAMSLIVGLALLACAVLAFIDGDVLGVAAANNWTKLGWAVAGGLLLLNLFAPRTREKHRVDDRVVEHHETPVVRERAVTTEPATEVVSARADEPLAAEDRNRDDRGDETVRAGGRSSDGVVDTDNAPDRFRRE